MVDDAGRERVHEGGIDRQGAANLLSDVDPEGFEALVDKYHRRIFNVIYRYVGDYYEAYDLTQDTFLRAYQSFQQFRGESTAYTWLYRIAINLSHNRIKQLKRKARSEAESLDDPIDVNGDAVQREVADWSMSPERVAESKELQGVLQRAIQSLPENYRAVILLRDVEGLSYQDIAKATGSSVEAVKSRLFRARSHLKGLLEPYLRGEV